MTGGQDVSGYRDTLQASRPVGIEAPAPSHVGLERPTPSTELACPQINLVSLMRAWGGDRGAYLLKSVIAAIQLNFACVHI